jgi:O-methyltransferase domain
VIQRAEKVWKSDPTKSGNLDRIEFVSGDFFNVATLPKPKGKRNAYILRQILHDWNDGDCVRILRNLREVMAGSGASLCIVEVMTLISHYPA